MFRTRSPQGSLFQVAFLFPEQKAKRLERSWAEVFQERALPLIDEDRFAGMYCDDNGRPNRAVQTVLGVLILKEMFNLTDEEALEELEFNLLWHHEKSCFSGSGVSRPKEMQSHSGIYPIQACRVLAAARRKIEDCLVSGKALKIEGGNYEFVDGSRRCGSGHMWSASDSTGMQPGVCPICSGRNVESLPGGQDDNAASRYPIIRRDE